MQLLSQNNGFDDELLLLGALLLLLLLLTELLGGALALVLLAFWVGSVCWTMDWFRKAIFEAFIRAAGPSNDGHGEMHGVEQWLLLRSHWSSKRINSSALGPPLLCAPEITKKKKIRKWKNNYTTWKFTTFRNFLKPE